MIDFVFAFVLIPMGVLVWMGVIYGVYLGIEYQVLILDIGTEVTHKVTLTIMCSSSQLRDTTL